jgi:hypothetical protein
LHFPHSFCNQFRWRGFRLRRRHELVEATLPILSFATARAAFVSFCHWRPSHDQSALLNFIMYRVVCFALLVKYLTAIEYLTRLPLVRHPNGRGSTQ